MGFFNKDKEDNKQIFEMVTTVKREVDKVKTNEIAKIRDDIYRQDIEHTKEIKDLRDEIEMLRSLIDTRLNNIYEIAEGEKNLNFSNVCKDIDISNITQTNLKYYLSTKGLFTMNINPTKNSFMLNTNFNFENSEFKDILYIRNNTLLFKEDFINYCKNHKDEIIATIDSYDSKQKQYKKSKKSLESRNVKNYQNEINMICGTRDKYDAKKWAAIYKIFGETYKSFEKDYEKYKQEHHVDGEYDITKVSYVISIMGEGNFLLKIACDLYA